MQLFKVFLIDFWNYVMGHIVLAIYLFAVINKGTDRKYLKKLPSLLLSPFFAALLSMGLSVIIPNSFILQYIIISAFILILCTFWMMWVWRNGFWQSFSCVCMAAILQVATSAMAQILVRLFGVDTLMQYMVSVGISFLPVFVIVLIMNKLHFGRYFRILMEEETGLRQTALLIFALEVVMEAFLILQSGVYDQYLSVYSLLLIGLAALITGLVGYFARWLDASRKILVQQEVIIRQQLYEQDLEDIRREVRSFRHDYKNLLAGLFQQAGSGELDELQQSLARLDAGFDRHLGEKIQISAQIGNLQIPQVRSLLLSKIAAMRETNVECRLEALYPVEHIGMEVWDFVRCLGILVDNAMEAAVETEQPWVEIVMLQQENMLTLHISNPYRNQISMEHIWEGGWSTKGSGRGLGLSGYQRILEGYPHAYASASWNNGIFVQELTIGGRS